jgi:hypothetical protein
MQNADCLVQSARAHNCAPEFPYQREYPITLFDQASRHSWQLGRFTRYRWKPELHIHRRSFLASEP